MVNLTRDKFEKLLNNTPGVENYTSTFVVNGVTHKKKDFEIKVKRFTFWSIFNCIYSRVRIDARHNETLYDRPKVMKVLGTRVVGTK